MLRKNGWNNIRALIFGTESWSFILSVVICHDLLFQINRTSKVMQTSGDSLEVAEIEIKATEKVLKKHHNNGCNSAVTCTRKMPLQIDDWFAESRPRKMENEA